ncbi:DNA-binding CsgD family transcriptional regulator [Agromyces sp. 3263]|uniref:helix-turn-helix transcriptional regulator n=1 Tax=Agromyces sp. 3263 TaxID=2817750 RepID=UPI0028543000|nr:AAA family ATPase [Agromyces sp. 3263]MDR6906590.1 DNA-binding CsgD family transcriptional regulator [Agromyces sp. 3263]
MWNVGLLPARTPISTVGTGGGLPMRNEEHRALRGRREECAQLDRLLASAASGNSEVLVLRGEAGVGKSALLGYLAQHAAGFVISRASGVESEVDLSYATLQQLCAPFIDVAAHLPEPQRHALDTAFGARGGERPDRFLVGLAVLGLFAEVAETTPLLCILDDAQWVDALSAQVLTFVARRVAAERIAIVFAVRDAVQGDEGDAFDAVPALAVHGLGEADAAVLLDSVVAGPFDQRVRSRILAEARGNPLALIELPLELDRPESGFGIVPVQRGSISSRIESGFVRRMDSLPAATRELLLIAAAEPMGDVSLLWRAATLSAIPVDAIEPAQDAGLVELGGQVRFRHPLMRSAIYRAATERDRRRAHRILADAMVGDGNADCLAWHRGVAASGLDDVVAGDLELAAARAQVRGGWTAAAAFLARSMELTPDPEQRARRALAAAFARLQAGSTDGARSMLAIARAGPLSDLDDARAQLLGAQITFASTRGREAPSLLLLAAKRLQPLDATLARETYLEAFTAALFAGRLADGGAALEDVARAILDARWDETNRRLPSAPALLLDGLATLVEQGYAAGAPMLRRALDAMRSDPFSGEDVLPWLWPAARAARAVGDDVSWLELTSRHVELARRTGALGTLPIALAERVSVELFTGDLEAALALAVEAEAVTTATGNELSPHIPFLLAAWRGDETRARALIDASRTDVAARGEGVWLMGTELTSSVFLNSYGRYEEALAAAERAAEHPFELGLSTWVYPELIEAAVRSDQPGRAAVALDHLVEIAVAGAGDWSLGVLARCRALLSSDEDAEALYRESVERLSRTRIGMARARAQLLYGEWLRRIGRRVDAREQLRPALEFFADAGLEGFVERTRRELAATGETVRARSVDTANDLTAQETLIARLAAEGRSNPEIGAQLFLSPRTVEWHLGKVFTKLGVESRKGLRATLRPGGPGLGSYDSVTATSDPR